METMGIVKARLHNFRKRVEDNTLSVYRKKTRLTKEQIEKCWDCKIVMWQVYSDNTIYLQVDDIY